MGTMTCADIVEISTKRPVDTGTAKQVVAAQLRGEARTDDHVGGRVVQAVAAELESSGFVPNVPELRRRYRAGSGPGQQVRASA